MSHHDLDIRPVAGRIGAEVAGVTLSADLPDATVAAIDEALHRYKVLFFRDQGHLDDASQEAFAARLGDPVAHPTVPVAKGSSYLLDEDIPQISFFPAGEGMTDIGLMPLFINPIR